MSDIKIRLLADVSDADKKINKLVENLKNIRISISADGNEKTFKSISDQASKINNQINSEPKNIVETQVQSKTLKDCKQDAGNNKFLKDMLQILNLGNKSLKNGNPQDIVNLISKYQKFKEDNFTSKEPKNIPSTNQEQKTETIFSKETKNPTSSVQEKKTETVFSKGAKTLEKSMKSIKNDGSSVKEGAGKDLADFISGITGNATKAFGKFLSGATTAGGAVAKGATAGAGGAIAGGASALALPVAGIAIAVASVIGKKLFSDMKEGSGKALTAESKVFETLGKTNYYGNDLNYGRKDWYNVGKDLGFSAEESLDVGSSYMNKSGYSNMDKLQTDVKEIQTVSKAYGLNPESVASTAGDFNKMGVVNDGDQRKFVNLLADAIQKNKMVGREGEQLEVMKTLAENIYSHQVTVSQDGLMNLMNMQSKMIEVNEGFKGEKGADAITQLNDGIRNGDAGTDMLLGLGTEYKGIEGYWEFLKAKAKGIEDPENLERIAKNFELYMGQDASSTAFKISMAEKFKMEPDAIEELLSNPAFVSFITNGEEAVTELKELNKVADKEKLPENIEEPIKVYEDSNLGAKERKDNASLNSKQDKGNWWNNFTKSLNNFSAGSNDFFSDTGHDTFGTGETFEQKSLVEGDYKDHAIGKAYVPYDGYKARLHKGETVLSKIDADNWRSSSSQSTNSNQRPTAQQKYANDLLDKELKIIEERKSILDSDEELLNQETDNIKSKENTSINSASNPVEKKQSVFDSILGMITGKSSSLGDFGNKLGNVFGIGSGGQENSNTPNGKSYAYSPDTEFGSVAKSFETSSEQGDFGAVGKDNIGWAYGAYQLNSEKGSLKTFLEKTKYGESFKGLTAGTEAFNNKWKEIASTDKDFAGTQTDFVMKNHYDVLNKRVEKALGADISKKGRATQEMLLSTSIQYGGYTKVVENALKNKDIDKLSNKDIVSLVQDYKYDNVNSLFTRNNGEDARSQKNGRIPNEKSMLVGIAEGEEAEKLKNNTEGIIPKHDITGVENIPKFAIGNKYIPFDGYMAELHKGEAVLPKFEADEWRSGKQDREKLDFDTSSSMPDEIFNRFLDNGFSSTTQSTQNINLNISGKILNMDDDNQAMVSSALQQYYAPDLNSINNAMAKLETGTIRKQR